MYRSVISVATAISILLSAMPAASVAATRLVAPKQAALKFRNVRCPGEATMKFTVWSRKAGPVRIQLERRGRGIVGSDILRAETRRRNAFRGIRKGTVRLSRSSGRASYRIIASGGGKVRRSRWVTLNFCKLAI